MGITANTEKRTKTQGPNINSNRQWESQQTQRNEPKNQGPNINPIQTMGITANTEKRTKTQGPNINSNRQ